MVCDKCNDALLNKHNWYQNVLVFVVVHIVMTVMLKMDFRLKKMHIHLYFIATQCLCNDALVEDIDNWSIS